MTTLIEAPLHGEIVAPDETVRVIGLAHPLKGKRIDVSVPAGLSIKEILQQALEDHPGSRLSRHFAVHLDGHPIPEKNWPKVRLKAGTTLTFRPTLHGDNPLRTILSVAIAIAAFVVAGPLAGALGLTGIGLSLGTALISTGIILAGTLALNALFPTRPAAIDGSASFSQLNSVQGANNQANPFGPIPVVLGKHRQSPYYGAKPYTEIVGDDQFLRLLFVFGYGPLSISNHRIGETPLESFDDVEMEVFQGFAGDAKPSLYPGQVDEQALSVELTLDNSWQSRMTAAETDEFSFDVTAPEGVFLVNAKTGALDNWFISLEYRWRPAGALDWTGTGNLTIPRSSAAARKGVRIQVERGQWEVQLRKTSGFSSGPDLDKIKDKAVWSALRSIKNVSPINFAKPLAMVSMRIRATSQLSGVLDTYNADTESLVHAYDGEEWVDDQGSQWPSDLFRHILQGPANARPQPDELIDLDNLADWWEFCVENGFKFNQVRSSVSSVYDALADVAAAGRAAPTFIDGKWGVIWDRPTDPIVQHFTPRNSWDFSGDRAYAQQPHGWRVKFINEKNGYTQDERIVYADGYDKTSAHLFEGIEFPGVTDPDLNWKHGRFHIAQAKLRPEKLSLTAGWETLICQRGDRVLVTHDVLLIGLTSGRVKSVVGQVVTFDEVVTIEVGKTYGVQFRVPEDVRSFERAVDPGENPGAFSGEFSSLTLVGDLSLVKPGTLFAFGETERESAKYRVYGLDRGKNLNATVVLVDDAPEISLADKGPIPAFDPHVTIPPDPQSLAPTGLTYQETFTGQGGSAIAIVELLWSAPRLGRVASFEVQQRDDNANGGWVTVDTVLPPQKRSVLPLTSAGTWSYRVRAVFTDGTTSGWVSLENLTLLGLLRKPEAVSNLRNTYVAGRMHLAWDKAIDPRTVPVEVRKGSSFEAAQIISDDAAAPWQTVGDDIYWVTTYVTTAFGERIYSEPKQSIEIERSVALENVVVSHDERSEGWTGYFSGSVGKDTENNYLRTSGGDPFLDRPNFLNAPFLDQGVQSGGYYWSRHVVNVGRRTFCRISNDWTAAGVPEAEDFLGNPDFLGKPDFLSAYLSQFIRVRPVIRISKSGPGDLFAETNFFEPDDVFFEGTEWESPKVWSPDVYDGWLFQMGMQFEVLTDVVPDPKTIAYLLSWVWTVDVPDRLDSYQNLNIPADGLVINFRPTGSEVDAPFNGGLNNEPLPHLTPSIRNPVPGDEVVWQDLTVSSVRMFVKNGGVAVTRGEVNVLVRGY